MIILVNVLNILLKPYCVKWGIWKRCHVEFVFVKENCFNTTDSNRRISRRIEHIKKKSVVILSVARPK